MEYPNLPERKLIDIPANSRASRGTCKIITTRWSETKPSKNLDNARVMPGFPHTRLDWHRVCILSFMGMKGQVGVFRQLNKNTYWYIKLLTQSQRSSWH